MSVSTPDAPASTTEWTLGDALRESGFLSEYTPAEGTADTPPAAPPDAPSETGRAADKAATEPKAETATETDSDAGDDGKTYTREQYERSRAEANRQRDLAAKARDDAAAELERTRASLTENEFQRGVLLRTDQLLESLMLQKGHTTLEDKRAAQIQAYGEMQSARERIVEADLQKVAQESSQQQWSEQQIAAHNAEAEALFTRNWATLQREAGAAGVPTFDAETALRDILSSAAYTAEIEDINSLPDRARVKAAADRIYDRAMREVRTKFAALADARQAAPPQQQAQSPQAQQPFTQQLSTGVQGFNVDDAFERAFDPDSYNATIQANPHLRGR